MVKQSPQGGSIVAISSISALVRGAEQTHYTPTKAGIKVGCARCFTRDAYLSEAFYLLHFQSLMESCAVALGKHNIRCNSALPGTIRTPINDKDLAREEKRRYMEGRVPLQRLGEPSDIAGPAVFLACDLAKYSELLGCCSLLDHGRTVLGDG